MKRLLTVVALLALLSTSLVSTATAAPGPEKSYILIANGNALPAALDGAVNGAGGEVEATMPGIGVAIASSTDPGFKGKAAKIKGVRAVVPNLTIQWIDPAARQAISLDEIGNPPNSGASDPFFDLQWGHTAIEAPAAWAGGATGEGVRVAVLDDGIDADHPDLAPNLNLELSRSFVPDEGFDYPEPGIGDHGAHVAGTIAAARNDFGVIGVAYDAEIVAVKVLSFEGSGSFAGVIEGIIYAADIDSDIINMSLGAYLERGGFCTVDEEGVEECMTAREVAEVVTAINRATTYAYQQGTTVISSAGNDGINSNKDRSGINIPADSPNVISVSALGPMGWAIDPETNLDEQAFYTNYGLSSIDFSAPGGNVDFDLNASGDVCVVGVVAQLCWAFDLVFSTGNGGWYWSAGTSMAAPHVSGVAALIIGENGGSMHPSHVESRLRATADDLGKPGRDALHGHGRVNAGNVVR